MDAKTLPKVEMPNRNGFVPPKFADIPDEKSADASRAFAHKLFLSNISPTTSSILFQTQ